MSTPSPSASGSTLTRKISQTLRLSLKRGLSNASRKSSSPSPPLPTPSKEFAGFFHPSMVAASAVPTIVVEEPSSSPTRGRQQENVRPASPGPEPAVSNVHQSGILRRSKSSVRRQKRREVPEDQKHQREWQARERSSVGHFDLNINLCPDTSSMVNEAVVGDRIVPSSLSTFAPRGPLVLRKD